MKKIIMIFSLLAVGCGKTETTSFEVFVNSLKKEIANISKDISNYPLRSNIYCYSVRDSVNVFYKIDDQKNIEIIRSSATKVDTLVFKREIAKLLEEQRKMKILGCKNDSSKTSIYFSLNNLSALPVSISENELDKHNGLLIFYNGKTTPQEKGGTQLDPMTYLYLIDKE